MARLVMEIEQILDLLTQTPNRLCELTERASEQQLHEPPASGEWSVAEILAHLRSCSDVWGDAIETIVSADHPTIRAVNPVSWIKQTGYGSLDFSPSFRDYRDQRDRLIARLRGLSKPDWARAATVIGGGRPIERTVHTYADRLARHERSHWRQVAKTVITVVGH